jgi:hypothetical protein
MMEEEEYNLRGYMPKLEKQVKHNTGFIALISDIFEMFLPRVIDVFISMSGSDVDEKPKGKNPPPHEGFFRNDAAPGRR